MEKLPVFEPYLCGNEAAAVARALEARCVSGTSPVIGEFETNLSKFLKSNHALAVANGTAALHVATLGLGLRPGDEVIIPNFTIISNAIGVTLCGAKPVFVDVSPQDWCLDASKLEAALTPKTVGIMAVHIFGSSCDMDALSAFAKQHKLWLIEDAAQAQGATWRQRPLGTIGDVGTFSFYANKLITTGEGGAVICQEKSLRDKMAVVRNLGFSADPTQRFIHSELSNNYRMSSLQGAMGIAQLEKVDELMRHRARVKEMYQEALGEPQGFSFPIPRPECTPAFWMSALCLDDDVKISIDELTKKLQEKGIETRRFFYPLNKQPALKGHHSQENKTFAVSERLFNRGIYLPSSSHLKWEQVQFVSRTFKQMIRS